MWEQKKLVRCPYCYKQLWSYTQCPPYSCKLTHTYLNRLSFCSNHTHLAFLTLFFFLMPNHSQLLGIKDKKQKCDLESHHVCFVQSISSTHSLIFHFRVPVLPKKLQTALSQSNNHQVVGCGLSFIFRTGLRQTGLNVRS